MPTEQLLSLYKMRNVKLKFVTGLCIAAVAGFAAIFYLVSSGSASGFDDGIRGIFYDLRQPALTPAVRFITYLGNYQTIVVLCLVLLIAKPVRITYGIPIASGAAFVTILNKFIKHAVNRPRPSDVVHLVNEGGFSFPSGHSITSMFVYGLLIYLVRKNVKNRRTADFLTIVLAVPLVLIGPSRIYLGVHYPTDVLAGWCLGAAAAAVWVMLIRKFSGEKNRI